MRRPHSRAVGFRVASFLVLVLSGLVFPGQSQAQTEDALDVVRYEIDAEVIPDSQTLRATAAVTMKASRPVQSVIFELNGSLEVKRVVGPSGESLQFVQDRLKDLNVRVGLSRAAEPDREFTLTFEYAGQLVTPDGGVLPTKRLAYVGRDGVYLTYAARWFPFHAYAADVATYRINFVAPSDMKVVAFGDHAEAPYVPPAPVKASPGTKPPAGPPTRQTPIRQTPTRRTPRGTVRQPPEPKPAPETPAVESPLPTGSGPRTRHTFTCSIPVLPGTIAAAPYVTRSIQRNGFTVDVFVKPGNEATAESFGETMAEAGAFFAAKFGPYAFGPKLQVAEIDNESLESYTTAGVSLFAAKQFEAGGQPLTRETLVRETAYQWWGQGVGLKSFDDVWVSQGIATYSYLLLEASLLNPRAFVELCRDVSERALAFESQASIARAPAELDDQSAAYRSIVFYKGAFVLRMLELVMGREKVITALRTYYEQFRGKRAGIADFERVAATVNGSDLRQFFALWIDSTGIPEFQADYQIIRARDKTFRVRGTVEQNLDTFRLPVEIAVEFKGGVERTEVKFDGKTADFVVSSKDEPRGIIIDPDAKVLQTSEQVRVAVIVRRAIQHLEAEEYAEAQQQFEAAIKLNRRSSWAYYNLGLLYLRQKNYERARDAFDEVLDGDLQPGWLEAWAYLRRGNVYDLQGNRDRAVAEYQKVRQLGDTTDGVQDLAEKYIGSPYRGETAVKSSEK